MVTLALVLRQGRCGVQAYRSALTRGWSVASRLLRRVRLEVSAWARRRASRRKAARPTAGPPSAEQLDDVLSNRL
eukprot:scaffold168607_cov37-Tisochrysis_lutea.AAC.1